MSEAINHAIIGCGRIASNHVTACRMNQINVVACCDLDRRKARTFALANNIPIYTDNYLWMSQDNSIDSISICTDHKSHVEIARDFVGLKYIIIEKPLSVNLQTARIFDDYYKANKRDKFATVIAQHRFDFIVNLVKRLLYNKVLGEVTLVNASLFCMRSNEYYEDSYWRGTYDKEGGSTLINQAYHVVDIVSYLFGRPQNIKSFNKNLQFRDIIETEDTSVSIWEYERFLCSIVATNTSNIEWKTSIRIVGTKGFIEFNIDFPQRILDYSLDLSNLDEYRNDILFAEKVYEENISKATNYYGLSHNIQFANFRDAILRIAELKGTLQDALATQSIIESIYKG